MRKKIYSDGKNRNLDLGFEIPFNNSIKVSLEDGSPIPFIMSKRNKIRFTKSIPTGDIFIDTEENAPIIKPFSLDTLGFSFIQKKDLDRLNVLAQQLGINEQIINKKEIDIKALGEAIKALETQNAQKIDENWVSVQNSLKLLYNELIGLNGATSKKADDMYVVLSDALKTIEATLNSHLKAKNPHKITKSTIGLENVDNTSDLDKPISDAVRKALELKLDVEALKDIYDKIEDEKAKNEKFRELNVWGGAGTGSGTGEASNVIFRSW